MRPTGMFRLVAAAVLFVSLAGAGASAQTAVGGPVTPFRDTSMLKPPAGAKVAIIEWEDMECPACAHAFPFIHSAMAQYHVPLVRHDFKIHNNWSPDAAVYARYMQDKLPPDVATDYRRQVFASQFRIATRDDLKAFTQQFLSSHHQQMPFVVDPTGQFAREVQADHDLGEKLGLHETPTIIVATQHNWIQVKDVSNLTQALDEAEKEAAVAAPASSTAAHRTTAHK